MLNQENILHASGIIVQKPFMLRRAIATARFLFPAIRWTASCETITVIKYLQRFGAKFINIIVGDTQRIILYPHLGYFADQEVPVEVVDAMNLLIDSGYTGHLVIPRAATIVKNSRKNTWTSPDLMDTVFR